MRRSTMGRPLKIPHVKRVKRGAVEYLYFKSGRLNERGKPILIPLPRFNDPSFWPTINSLQAGREKRENVSGELTLPAFISLFMKSERWRKMSANTQVIYGIYLKRLVAAFGKAPANDLRRSDMMRLLDGMADTPGAANVLLKATGSLYTWGRSREHVTARPCDEIDLFELGEHEPWPADLLDKGLASEDPIVRLSVHLLYYTGQRIGDVCKMRWSDYREGRIEIVQEKRGHVVSIPPHPALKALLAETPRAGLTILSIDARPIKREAIRFILKKWASDQGASIVPHGLRKNAVNALLEAGCSAAEAAAITKQSLAMVEHYAKARDGRRLADAAVLKWSRPKA
jgi:integrase